MQLIKKSFIIILKIKACVYFCCFVKFFINKYKLQLKKKTYIDIIIFFVKKNFILIKTIIC